MTFSWDSPTFGQPGHNVHVATSGNYGPDDHDDSSNGDAP